MKKLILLMSFGLFSSLLQAHDIREFSFFSVMGDHELRAEEGFDSEVLFSTMNHEGGMRVRVLEIGKRDSRGSEKGVWVHVLTVYPMWVDSGDWIEEYSRFWFFLSDEQPIYIFQR